MNTRLENVFNLDSHRAVKDEAETPEEPSALELIADNVQDLDKIDQALPQVIGLEASEGEMDDLAQMATEGYQQLMELGMNVETRQAAEIFTAASSLLGHALTAKKNKIEKKLKMIELQLKKKSLDIRAGDQNVSQPTLTGTATVIDRNALLADILGKKSGQTDK